MRDSGAAKRQRGAGSDAQDRSVTKRTLLTPLLPNGAFPLLNLALCRSREAGAAHAETQSEQIKPQTHCGHSPHAVSMQGVRVLTHFSQTSAKSLISRLARHLA